jgi:arginyl-tRNA synthetase
MKVVLKSVEQFRPELVERTRHLTHGIVKLSGGVKMSSRLGNILGATDVINFAAAANRELTGKDDENVTLGAVKYSFLKQRIGGDIIYDPAESVSIEGNSGPYLQYAHARVCSILAKSGKQAKKQTELDASERNLLRKISEYAEVVTKATEELMPHHVCTYLYELAQEFNSFYEQSRIIDDPREQLRLALVSEYRRTLADGLKLLGIAAPEKM